jgi:hypothetical protein
MKDYSLYKGKEQTYLKHLVLENYLERLSWIIGFGSDYGKICYVDGFPARGSLDLRTMQTLQ